MLNPQLCSSSKKFPTTAPTSKNNQDEKSKRKQKQKQKSPLTVKKKSPLQNLNFISRTNSNISSTSTASTISSSMSIEAHKGCLRLFLSSNPSCSSSKPTVLQNSKKKDCKSLHKNITPKSAPGAVRPSKPKPTTFAAKLSKENHVPKRPTSVNSKKNPSPLYQWQSGKNPTSINAPKPNLLPVLGSKVHDSVSGSGEFDRDFIHFRQFRESPNPVVPPKFKLLADSGKSGRIVNDLASGSDGLDQNLMHFRQKEQKKESLVSINCEGESIEGLEMTDLNSSIGHVVDNCTPVGKIACSSGLDNAIDDEKPVEEGTGTGATHSKTPPIQSSLSPEIPYEFSSAKTPSCYAAGHVLSGVTDSRKCKPRGILIVGNKDSSACGNARIFNTNSYGSEENIMEAPKKSRASLVPSPVEASMRWLLSPHNEDALEDEDGDLANGCCELVDSALYCLPSSPLSCRKVPFGLNENANNSDGSDISCRTGRQKTRITLLSPRRSPEFQCLLGSSSDKVSTLSLSASPITGTVSRTIASGEGRKYQYNLDRENSPFSAISLDSENVIQTPTDSGSDRHVGCSWLNAKDNQKHPFESEFDSVADFLRRASLSPRSQISMRDPPGLSFQFTDLTSSSNSIDLMRLRKTSANRDSWVSSYSSQNMSPSPLRISWREGLVSRMFEMDEFDCCRCLSDEENDVDGHGNNQLKPHPSPKVENRGGNENNSFRFPKFIDDEPSIVGKGKSRLSSERPSSCAESICTDGGGLVASGDSDWNLCYKNQLFQA